MGHPITDLFKINTVNCSLQECEKGQYLCNSKSHCIDIELICDGINHCYHGDDEFNCGKNKLFKNV